MLHDLGQALDLLGLELGLATGPGGLLEEEQVVNSLESEGGGQRGRVLQLRAVFLGPVS